MVNLKITVFLILLFFAAGCAQSIALSGSPAVPAALGEVKVSKDGNNNTLVEVEVRHLAQPENLSPKKSVYVVWAQAPQGRTINLGQMVVGKNRVGKFNGVTPLDQFRIIITAEELAAVATPGKEEILSTEVLTVN